MGLPVQWQLLRQIWDPVGTCSRNFVWLKQAGALCPTVLCVPLLQGGFQPLTSDILPWYRYSSPSCPGAQCVFLLGSSLSPESMAQLMKQLLYCGRFQPGAIKKKRNWFQFILTI